MELTAIDIVLPCYNPQTSWLNELLDFYKTASTKFQINFIIVNDGSVNKVLEGSILSLEENRIPFKIISYPKNKGKGYALRNGVLSSKNKYVVYTDIDFPFTNASTIKMMDLIASNNYDVLAGTRNQNYYQKNMSAFRKQLSKTFRFVIKLLFNLGISDTQCGLKAFNEIGKHQFLSTRINRYLFDFEFIYICSKKKQIRVLPVEVDLKDNVVFSKMKLKILIQESINLFYLILFRRK